MWGLDRYIILVTRKIEKRLDMTVDDMNDDTLAWLVICDLSALTRTHLAALEHCWFVRGEKRCCKVLGRVCSTSHRR